MKRFFIVFTIAILLFTAATECGAEEITVEDTYSQQYKASGADKLSESLPEGVKQQMDEFDISASDTDWADYFTPKNIFQEIWSFLKTGGKRPLTAGCAILAVLLFGSAVKGMADENKTVGFAVTVGITAVTVLPTVSSILSCVSALKSAGVFMLSFVPVYASILVSKGKTLTAAGFSSVMLVAAEAVTAMCSFIIVPLTGMQLGLSVSSSVLEDVNTSSVSKAIKKTSLWLLTLATTVFLALLGIQTVVKGSADSLSAKTVRFFVGTAVPVVGSVVGDALSTVKGCLKLLSSSVAIYGIVALATILLPVILELLLWRVVLLLTSSAAELLGQDKSASLIRSVDSATAMVLGISVLVTVLFVIAITMVSVIM